MRQRLSDRKVKKYRDTLNLPIVSALVRGGTDHRVDLLMEGGHILEYWPKSGKFQRSTMFWQSEAKRYAGLVKRGIKNLFEER